MKSRCNNKNDVNYKNYWWRGITYCDRREEFENFYDDMYDKYFDWSTLDRIDVDWNYCKQNCRRATYKQQSNNKRNNKKLKIDWKTKTVAEWLEFYSMDWRTYYTRVRWWMWEIDAMKKPVKKYHKLIKYDWKSQTLKERSKELWIKYKTLYRRLKIKKYPIHVALSKDRYDWKTIV